MVGHWVIGVPFSSIKLNNLSRKTRRSGWSSISYNRARLSELREDVCANRGENKKHNSVCKSFTTNIYREQKSFVDACLSMIFLVVNYDMLYLQRLEKVLISY